MKTCINCNKKKSSDKFELVISPAEHGGNGKQYRRKTCKACRSAKANSKRQEYRKTYNIENKDKRRERASKLRAEAKSILNKLKMAPCIDCNKTFAPVAMDFDHLKEKHQTIARMLSTAYKIDFILEEIKKCELVCACCHRTRTLKRKGRKEYPATSLSHYIDKIKSETSCKICNKYFSPECVDFDHRSPADKVFNIEQMRRYSVKNIQELLNEMAKCDIICACCHRIRTHAGE